MAHTHPEPGLTDGRPMAKAVKFEADQDAKDLEWFRNASDEEIWEVIKDVSDLGELIADSAGHHDYEPAPRIPFKDIEVDGGDHD